MLRHALHGVLNFLLRKVVLKGVGIPVRRRLARFEAASCDPRRVQQAVLTDILRVQSQTGFGKDHHFASIRTVEDFRR
ncbi:MAG: GH3 auxin-responsive promoter family protein, partial [Gemmataceae bacterium]